MSQTTDLLATRPETILLKGKLRQAADEHQAGEAITPGFLAELHSDNKLYKHSKRGGRSDRRFALEAFWTAFGPVPGVSTTGGTVDDAYASGDIVREHQCIPTDEIWAVLHGGENVSKEDALISYGDGTLAKAAAAALADTVADSTTVTNTTAETTFSTGTVTIPKNTLKAGDIIRFHALVNIPAQNSTDTLAIKVKLGSTTVLTVPAFDPATGDVVEIDGALRVRTVGATGTFIADGTYTAGVPGTATARSFVLASTTFDTTADLSLTVTATWSVANAGNQAILSSLVVDQVSEGATGGSLGTGAFVIAVANETLDLSSTPTTNGRIRVRIP